MTQLIIFLLSLSLIQTAFLGSDWVLLVLIIRGFLVPEKNNLWLSFSFGLLVSFLQGSPLGILSLIYLTAVMVSQIIKNTRLTSHFLIILPLSISLLTLNSLVQSIIFEHSFDFKPLVIQAALTLPLYFILLFWEDRFVPKPEIKLKLKR